MADSPLKQQLTEAMKAAMRARDKARLGTIRMALADIKRVEVDERIDPDDTRVLAILEKMIKQRRDAAKQFEDAGRKELADTENAEIVVLESFMPSPLSDAEVSAIINKAVTDTGANGMPDMGKVMNVVRPQVAGRADMGTISQQVKQRLSGN
jgi:uncharacterized protein YqeY